jgi:hypothetical protein
MKRRTNMREAIRRTLADERGQSWVETVVMLPVLVLVLVGLFWMKDLTDMRIRAVEAARYVTWEHVAYVREDRPNRAVKSNDDLRTELRQIGLGRGLRTVAVTQRPLSTYLDQIDDGKEGFGPQFFFPQAFGELLGLGAQNAVPVDLFSVFGDAVNLFLDVGAAVGVPVHEIMAYQTNWNPEADRAVQTSTVRYQFGYTGFLASISNIRIDESSSLLTHPLNIKRVNKSAGGDAAEYDMLIGADLSDCANFSADGEDAHIFPLWLLPTGGIPAYTPAIGGLAPLFGVGAAVGNAVKLILCGGGGILQELDDALGGVVDIGWRMPDGTLKEFPELNVDDAGTTSTGSDSSGSGLGGCESTGPTGTTIPGC